MIEVEELRFAYGNGPPVLSGVDLTVDAGEIILLTGPSGGGKSTLLRALRGLVPHFHGGTVSGRIEVAGRDPLRDGPTALGGRVAYVFQEPEAQAVFDIVGRDIAFGPRAAGWPGIEVQESVARVAAQTGVASMLDRETATLSGGERQRAALAAALATKPDVLLLDEPTSQLDTEGVQALVDLLQELATAGTTVVVAEHRTDALGELDCRRVALGAAPPRAGGTIPPAHVGPDGGEGALEVRGLRCGYDDHPVLVGLDAYCRGGEITMVDGPNGSGKSTLLRAIAGHLEAVEGEILLGGQLLEGPPEARYPKLAHVAQDAVRHTLTESVADEIAYGLRRVGVVGSELTRRIDDVAGELGLEGVLRRHPGDLSVGQRQSVVLAGALAVDPVALVLDEPTRGLDPMRVDRLVEAIARRAARGAVVLIASHDRVFSSQIADARLALDGDSLAERTPV